MTLRRFTALIAVLVVLVAACSSSGDSDPVATVGDTTITQGELAELFESATLPVDEDLRATIFALVARQVFVDSLEEDFGATLDEERVEQLYAEFLAEMDLQGADAAAFLGVPNAGLGMVRFDAEIAVIRQQAVEGLVRDPTTADRFFENPAEITTVCAQHILLETEEEANAVLTRLGEGEDFGALANELSLDAGAEGNLGCRLAWEYVAPFAQGTLDAELGVPHGPVESEFGFHVILVSDRDAITREEFAADPLQVLSNEQIGAIWTAWFNEQLQDAEVEVVERYGSWSPVGIVPPE